MISLSLQQMLLHAAVLLIIAAVHGWAVAAAAVALGDAGPKYDGRRTVNPFNHLDLLGAAGVVLFSLGWIRPIEVDPGKLRSRWAPLLILAAGLAATLGLAALLRLTMPLTVGLLPGSAAIAASVFLSTAVDLSLWFTLFNLVPAPPLTGGFVWLALIPQTSTRLRRYMLYARLGLTLLVASGMAGAVLAPSMRWLSRIVQSL